MEVSSMNIFEQYESEVRGYCRNFPAVFSSAKGAWMTDTGGQRYLDFFSGAGVLNYGHNNDRIKQPWFVIYSVMASPTPWTCTAKPSSVLFSALTM